MAEVDQSKITEVASKVIDALKDLSTEEQDRVLQAAAALYGLSGVTKRKPAREPDPGDEEEGEDLEVAPPKLGKKQSLVEFLKEKTPVTNAQRIACFAYYREHVERRGANFARRDLEPYFGTAKLPSPGRNFDRDYNRAVSAGHIHDEGTKSYLTQGGEDAVSAGFTGMPRRPRGAKSAKKSRKAPAA